MKEKSLGRSETYRAKLAQKLRTFRSEGQKSKAKELLQTERAEHRHTLAQVLARKKPSKEGVLISGMPLIPEETREY